MSLIDIFQRFPHHAACIAYLEATRWGDTPTCPLCGSVSVARKADGDRIGRWNCHDCKSSFNVLHGTIFQKTKIPLQKWFLAIGLLLNAKKSISSCQLARDLEINQKSAWFLAVRVRMASDTDTALLQSIAEANECDLVGKGRTCNRRGRDRPGGRGRTEKMPVISIGEHDGQVVLPPAKKSEIIGASLKQFILDHVDPAGAVLRLDACAAFNSRHAVMCHATINHSDRYVNREFNNTTECLRSCIKRTRYGSHHHSRCKDASLYVVKQCMNYYEREVADRFKPFLVGAVA